MMDQKRAGSWPKACLPGRNAQLRLSLDSLFDEPITESDDRFDLLARGTELCP
jgi:hypothetical protein